MSVDTTSPTNPTSAAVVSQKSVASTAKATIGADYERFLQLLTAQIRNQDPLSPMDSTEFVSQLAQLSTVEQTVQTNTKLAEIAGQIAGVTAMADIGLIGRDVTLATRALPLREGQAEIAFETESAAVRSQVNILDETGTVVRTLPAPASGPGERVTLDWDGKTAQGAQLPDGFYGVEVNAEGADGETVAAATFATLRVQEVALGEGGSSLILANGDRVASTDVRAVR